VPRRKRETIRLSMFRGREARLNRAVIWAFGAEEPQTTRQLHQKIIKIKELRHTSYSTVNKRVRSLVKSGYLKKVKVKQRTGGFSNYYELRPKVYLAQFLASNNIYNLFEEADDQLSLTFLAVFKAKHRELNTQNPDPSDEQVDT
jgi:predicted transcriptional regulator